MPRRSTHWGLAILAVAIAVAVAVLLASGGDDEPAPPTRGALTTPTFEPLPCTRYLRPGARLARPLAGAAAGAAICLRDGSYPGGQVPAAATDKPDYVTLQAAPGASPVIMGELAFENARHLRLMGLSFRGGLAFSPAASHVELVGNDFSGAAGIFLFGDASERGRIESILIEGNLIHDIDYRGPQEVYRGYGIKAIGAQEGIAVRGNTIERVAADYLQTDEANGWTVDGNTFLGPSRVAGHPQEHQDLWQVYAGGRDVEFTDNVVRGAGTSQSLLFQLSYKSSRFSNVVVANNLFDHDSRGYTCQIYQSRGLVFRDNTIVGSHFGCAFRRDRRHPDGSGYQVDRNVFADTARGPDLGVERGVLGWGAFDFNVTSDGSAAGPNSVRDWRPAWEDTVDYRPLGLPFAAGFEQP